MSVGQSHRRLITILFADLSDSTGIAAGLEPEHFAELLEQFRAIVEKVIPAHGGDVIRLDGDGVLAIFGHPDPFEDAGRRATEAALDLNAAMTALDAALALPDRPLRLHTGIHAGLVLLRRGDMVRGKVEILGDATNTASRLCDAAAPGEILVSSETLGAERHAFLSEQVRRIPISGHGDGVPVLAITGRASAGSRFEARSREGLTPYQTRRIEELAFRDWLDGRSGANALMLVHGPAGIGKSRFVRQMVDDSRARGWSVVQGYCESYLSAQTLQPFRQIAAQLGDKGPETAEALRFTVLAAAARTPLLIVIDDWHWSDDASRDLLAALLSRPDGQALRIVIVSRAAETGLPGFQAMTSIALPPLGRDQTLAAIEALLRSPDPFAISRIEQASGGSPLLIEELCLSFARGGTTPQGDPRGAWFDLAVQARFHRLSETDKRVLMAAAAIGHVVPVWLLHAHHGGPLDLDTRARLQDGDFLFPGETDGTYRFKHGLTRDAIYAAIGLADRQMLHRAILGHLERAVAQGHPRLRDALAWHAASARDVEKGLRYGVAAGDAALAEGALDRAQAHYRACFALAETRPAGPDRHHLIWSLMNKFGLACIIDPAHDQLPLLQRAEALLRLSGGPREAARSQYWLGSIAYGLGLGKQSVRHLQDALEQARQGGSARDAAMIEVKLAQSLCTSGRYEEGLARFTRLQPLFAGAESVNDREMAAYALACQGFHTADQGGFATAKQLFDLSASVLQDAERAMNASSLGYVTAAAMMQGDWPRARTLAAQVDETSLRSRTRQQYAINRAKLAYMDWIEHGSGDALTQLERTALLFIQPDQSHQRASMILGWLIDVLAAQDERPRARFYMRHLIQRIRIGGDRLGEAMAWRAMALMEARNGAMERARRNMAHARRAASARQSQREAAHNLLAAATLAKAAGAPQKARQYSRTAADHYGAMGMPWFRAQAKDLDQPTH